MEKVLAIGKTQGLANHTVLIAKDGRERPIDDSASPIKNDEGRLTGVVLVFRDITERKQAEAELRRLREEERAADDRGESHSGEHHRRLLLARRGMAVHVPDPRRPRSRWACHAANFWAEACGKCIPAPWEANSNTRIGALSPTAWHDRSRPTFQTTIVGTRSTRIPRPAASRSTSGTPASECAAEAERERIAEQSEKDRRMYHAAHSNTPDLAYVFDLDHRFIYAQRGPARDVGSNLGRSHREKLLGTRLRNREKIN